MRLNNKFSIVIFNFIMGYISLWWFAISIASALNIDHEEENVIFIPFGITGLLILLVAVLGSNWAIYRYKIRTVKGLALEQAVPFVIGFCLSFLMAYMKQ